MMTCRPLHVLSAVVTAAVLVSDHLGRRHGRTGAPGGPGAGGRHGLVLTDAMG